jgi:nucleoside diphosphate kinase
MARELAFVFINPYTIAKSRTGGVIARYISRTDLSLVAARMIGPPAELVQKYADKIRKADSGNPETNGLIADYVFRQYMPHENTGRPRRVMVLLFEGEDAVAKIWSVTGSATQRPGGSETISGETIRGTYGDYIVDADGKVRYFEPAVLVGPTVERVGRTLRLWTRYTESHGGIVASAIDVPTGANVQRTLVILKPDNFRYPSLRAGNIIDILSVSGLRIVGVKKFAMTVAQAEAFYWPVLASLDAKFQDFGPKQMAEALTQHLGFSVPQELTGDMALRLGPLYAKAQFDGIVEFMTGYRPTQCSDTDKHLLGRENCLALVYEGADAVGKIRGILGATDPNKARPGSVRREFGSNIMVNAAHASDSVENAERELRIIKVEEDTLKALVDKYYTPDGDPLADNAPAGDTRVNTTVQ